MNRFLLLTAFLLLALTGVWFISERMKAPAESLKSIYESNMQPCMNYWTTDPSFNDTTSLHAQAMRLYDKREYPLAMEAFQRFEPNEGEEAYYNLYLGICYMQTDFENLAISHLKDAAEFSTKFEMIQLSKWYLSMAYLKAGRENEAVEVLSKLVEVNAPQRYQAQNILNEINRASNPIKSFLVLVSAS